ncbi:unnamed protein product [Dibothriocephalus latus]|uniref:Uncharacterized protein n=1 Tax=Dibothriocephalus latus TaxID=60516 RepID=A0A3P7LVX1_DIBLA|nr:unnamed protein product [Dibothriocephalus latus]
METKASRSVRSQVANLQIPGEELKTVLVDAFRSWLSADSLTQETCKVINVSPGDEERWVDGAEFAKNLETFSSWEWVFGASPKFTIPLQLAGAHRTIHVLCQKGRFAGFQEQGDGVDAALSSWLQQLAHALSDSPCKRNAWLYFLLVTAVLMSDLAGLNDVTDGTSPGVMVSGRILFARTAGQGLRALRFP